MSADFTLRDLASVVAVRLLLRVLRPTQLMHSDPASFRHPALPEELCRREAHRLDVGHLLVNRMEFLVRLRLAAYD
jgi:hypothetical protein